MHLTSVLQKLVGGRGHKLFVGVDEYDAPANQILFDNNSTFYGELSRFFTSQFFAIIKQATSEVIDKYWITGVLPVFRDGVSPLNAVKLISSRAEYHGLCGLTENEVYTITKEYLPPGPLDVDMILQDLRRWYNGHLFCNIQGSGQPLDTLYSPELVFTHLRALGNNTRIKPIDEIYNVQTSRVLGAIPDNGITPFIETFYRVQSGNLKAEILSSFGITEASQIGINPRITQTLLYHLGVFTFAADGRNLTIPNCTMICVVSAAFLYADRR